MNRKHSKKLQLNRWTVAVLSAADQKRVNGGQYWSLQKNCPIRPSNCWTSCDLTERISAVNACP